MKSGFYFLIKSIIDKIGAIVLLIMLAPVMLVIALAIRLTMGSPVLFSQERGGYKNRVFCVYKFSTMNQDRNEAGSLLPDYQRLTKLGKFLRDYSLDELPQLFNVIRNDMSFVGPRPFIKNYIELYSEKQNRRHEVKPGITGWAQINGRNNLSWEEKFELDVWYVDHMSLGLDVRILFITFFRVMLRKGINQREVEPMPRFAGNQKPSQRLSGNGCPSQSQSPKLNTEC